MSGLSRDKEKTVSSKDCLKTHVKYKVLDYLGATFSDGEAWKIHEDDESPNILGEGRKEVEKKKKREKRESKRLNMLPVDRRTQGMCLFFHINQMLLVIIPIHWPDKTKVTLFWLCLKARKPRPAISL